MSFKLRFEMFKQQSLLFSSVTPHKCNSHSIFLVFCALWRLIPLKCSHLHVLIMNDRIVRHLVCLAGTFIFPYLEESDISTLEILVPSKYGKSNPWNTTLSQIWQVFEINRARFNQSTFRWFLCLYYKSCYTSLFKQ